MDEVKLALTPQELEDRSVDVCLRMTAGMDADPDKNAIVHALAAVRFAATLSASCNVPLEIALGTFIAVRNEMDAEILNLRKTS